MPHSTNKELILGIMVGTTGISLLLLWYHKVRNPRTAMSFPRFLYLGNAFNSVTSQDEMHNGQGAAAVFQGRQLQISEKLNELLINIEDLKEEIRILKETIPKLEEYVRGELQRKTTAHRISPQHRARKRRIATAQSSGASNSSEEAESEGGCWKENQGLPPDCPVDQVTSDALHHEASSLTQAAVTLDHETGHLKIRRVSVPSPWITSSRLSFCGRRPSLLAKLQESSSSFQSQQSRVNFDSQEKSSSGDVKSSSEHFHFKSRRLSSTPKLSIISCYESALGFDLQPSCGNVFNPSETEILYENSSIADTEKYVRSCSHDSNIKHFANFETQINSSASRNSVARNNHQQSTATFFSFPACTPCSYQENEVVTDVQERSQLRKDSLHSGSQSHSTDHSPAVI